MEEALEGQKRYLKSFLLQAHFFLCDLEGRVHNDQSPIDHFSQLYPPSLRDLAQEHLVPFLFFYSYYSFSTLYSFHFFYSSTFMLY